MNKIILNRGKISLLVLLIGWLVLFGGIEHASATMIITPPDEKENLVPEAGIVIDKDINVIAFAKKHKISKGKWVKTSEGRLYQKKNGSFLTDIWCSIGGAVYYFDEDGYAKTGSFSYNKKQYYADEKGKVYVNKWLKTGKKKYYYNEKGIRVKGWEKIKGKKYYFTRTGELVTNSWVTSHYVGKKGAVLSGKTVQGRVLNHAGVIKKASKKDKYIFVGASHGVDMSIAVNSSNTIFIAKGGMGLKWLKDVAGPQLKSYLKKTSDYIVIFQLGGNDLENIEGYISYYEKLMKQYPKTRFYFLENIPGNNNYAKTYKNEAKRRYDARLKEAFPEQCIEAYDYMQQTGFRTVDGTHYVLADIKKVYNHMMKQIKALEGK